MIPLNERKTGCVPTSSNCVRYQGPNLDWLQLCKDSSITEVIIALANQIKTISNMLDITEYDMSCLDLGKCGPQTFDEVQQLILNKICELSNDETIDLYSLTMEIEADCFLEDNDGEKEISVAEYANMIAKKLCENILIIEQLKDDVSDLIESVDKLNTDVTNLKNNKQNKLNLTGYGSETDVEDILQNTINYVKEYISVLGSSTDLATDHKCNLSYYKYFFTDPNSDMSQAISINNTVADNIKNIWTVLCDMRRAVYNLTVNTSNYSIAFDGYLNCSGILMYKIKVTYDESIFENPSVVLKYKSSTYTLQLNQNDYKEIEINESSDNCTVTLQKSIIDKNTKTTKTDFQEQTILVYKAATDMSVTDITKKSDPRTISFKNNVSGISYKLSRTYNGTETQLKVFTNTSTGLQTYIDSDTLVAGKTYTYVLSSSDSSCEYVDKSLIVPEDQPSMAKSYAIGYVEDDEESVNVNEVEVQDIPTWTNTYNNTNE